MLFKPELCDKILAGTKIQTRRGMKEGMDVPIQFDGDARMIVSFDDPHIDAVDRDGRVVWVVGRTYAVQPGRGKDGVARIQITAIRYCARASDISEGDARAEGFDSAEQFREVYARINGAGALDRPCWALSFVRVLLNETPYLSSETTDTARLATLARADADPPDARRGGRSDRRYDRHAERKTRGDD